MQNKIYLTYCESGLYDELERRLKSENVTIHSLEDALEMASRGYPIYRATIKDGKTFETVFTASEIKVCVRDNIEVRGKIEHLPFF